MDDIVDVRVLLKHLVQLLLIGDIQRVVLGPLAADELNTVEDLIGRVVEVVDDDDLVVGFEERESSERPNIAGATMEEVMLAVDNGFVGDKMRQCRGLSHSWYDPAMRREG